MDRPTVFTRDEASDVQNDLDRAIGVLLSIRAAYDLPFVY